MKRSLLNRLLVFALCFVLCLPLFSGAAWAAEDRTTPSEPLAAGLKQLGLFRGVSDTDFDLDRAPTRAEALVMLIRMLGKEAEATGGEWTHPFADVPSWAGPYVGYAYEKGLTNGVSATRFGAEDAAGSGTYLTFMLRALGYSDRNGADFTWNNPYALATACGILPAEVDLNDFLRADAVLVSYAALTAPLKNSGRTLAEELIAEGAFTREQFDASIDKEAFSDSRALNTALSDAVMAHESAGTLTKYYFETESHIVLDTAEDGDTVRVSAMICYSVCHYSKNSDGLSLSSSVSLASVTLRRQEDGSYETADYGKLGDAGTDPSNDGRFSQAVLEQYGALSQNTDGMVAVCQARAETYRTEVFDLYQPTYEEAMAETVDREGYSVVRELTAANCTVVYGEIGGIPHAPYYCLDVVWFDGRTESLPLPLRNGWGANAAPDDISLSEDGYTLTYRVTFAEQTIIDKGLPSEMLVHEKGTYCYTVDLVTGEVTLTIEDN